MIPPPLAPELERASHPRLHLFLIVAVLVAAGLAQLLGAPTLLTAALFAIGIGALLLLAYMMRDEERLATKVDRTARLGRDEFESLSDRMWELQESEERFRGLIDALGDLVVHRDRDGRIVYTNAVFAELIGVPATSSPAAC